MACCLKLSSLPLVLGCILCWNSALCLAQPADLAQSADQSAVLVQPVGGMALHTPDRIWPSAALVGLDTDRWHFQLEDEQTIAPAVVCRWGSWPGCVSQSAVWLSDGSWLCGEVDIDETGGVSVRNDWLECPQLPPSAIRAIVWKRHASLDAWLDFWEQLQRIRGGNDTLWLSSGRKIEGVLRLTGEQEDRAGPSLQAQTEKLAFDWEEIDAVAISPDLIGQLPEKLRGTTLGLKDGSLLMLRNAPSIISPSTVTDAGRETGTAASQMRFSLDCGIELRSHDPADELLEAIRYLRQADPRTVYLSDLEPASYQHLPESSLTWSLGLDFDLFQRPLMVDQGLVRKGLALHSSSQVAYRWDGSPGRFLSEIRFAEPPPGANQELGSVDCQVLLAKSGQLRKAGQIALARSDDSRPAAAMFEVDITSARLIVLVTKAADRGQLGDHVLWLNARLTRQ